MVQDLTFREAQRVCNRIGCTFQISYSSGQWHMYIHRKRTLVAYDRNDDLAYLAETLLVAAQKEPAGDLESANPAPSGSAGHRSAAE